MSGLLTQINGLQQHLRKGYYKVRIGKRYLTEEQIKTNPQMALTEESTVHFTPVIAGAGKGLGIGQIIIGVVLIAATWYIGGTAGWSYLAMASGYAMGAAMILSGAMTLLTLTPNMDTSAKESEKKQSTSFSNIKNLTPQGRPIPLLYGEMMTSLVLISQGVETFDDMETLKKG
ncbi:tail assembly protein [Aggregatibacter aphrophilus]|uniref:tail assembly protein n=1 Tax=Aggregatibacter aphrophilus TaxID=732 RepID=UPI0009F34080|nr:tail assembly protein [Aggregatibacter aphrophilus]PNL89896.1 tail assembly protein [Aggregatibacter aphrophilus]PNL89903.1 tail assembly protein [Aggregatibacter aphrophilus]PNL93878.1 tail assembly protein [Aggregatibacter aphrophilus]PNL93883.1 tail assembly protein [Aggregatibacter aphrophilus]